tara:strand:- start:935 stop:1705 length:771 start_codon:yes stop_codon:yes gene_type:complete
MYKIPNVIVMLLFIIGIALPMEIFPVLLHTIPFFTPTEDSAKLAGSLMSPIGGATGLVIGFLLNQAQSAFREAESVCSTEAGKINNLDRLLLRYSIEETRHIRVHLQEYIKLIINDEWKIMQMDESSKLVHMCWRNISQEIFKLTPSTPKETTLFSDIIHKAEEVAEAREARLDRADKKLPILYWGVIGLLLTALMFINTMFIRSNHVVVGLTIMPVVFGGLTSLLVITDQPFKGRSCIKPTALTKILASILTRKS